MSQISYVLLTLRRALGSVKHQFRSSLLQCSKDLSTEYQRVLLLLKLLRGQSIVLPQTANTEIVTVVSHQDLPLWATMISSLCHHSSYPFLVTILSDGSLTKSDARLMERLVPTVKVFSHQQLASLVQKKFNKNKLLLSYLQMPYVIKKIGSYLSARSEKVLLIDSDVLFFQRPKEIEAWIDGKYDALYIEDVQDSYLASDIESQHLFGLLPVRKLNSGVLGINRADYDIGLFLDVLAFYDRVIQLSFRPPQFQYFFALLFARMKLAKKKILRLPRTYLVSTDKEDYHSLVCGHYVRSVREKFYIDALKKA